MNSQRLLGFALVVVGVVLFVIGTNSSHSIYDQLSNTFTGRFTEATQWYIVGGILSGVVGLLMLAAGLRGKSA